MVWNIEFMFAPRVGRVAEKKTATRNHNTAPPPATTPHRSFQTKAVVVPAAALDLVYSEVHVALRGEFEDTKQSTYGIRIEHY